jgi:hypothetical protein
MAGVFDSVHLRADDPRSVADAMKTIYEQSASPEVAAYVQSHGIDPSTVRMGLLFQKSVPSPDRAGVVFTNVGGDPSRMLVEYVRGKGEALVAGESAGSSVIVDIDTGNVIASRGFDAIPMPAAILRAIAEEAKKIRTRFGEVPQDIEFAVKGGDTYMLQARTLTGDPGNISLDETAERLVKTTQAQIRQLAAIEQKQLKITQSIFARSNFSELLPRPTEMDAGVFGYIFPGWDGIPGAIWSGRREMGYKLGEDSANFMYLIGGQAYVSIARDAGTFYAGFPDTIEEYYSTLVNEYLKTIAAEPARGQYPEMGVYLQDPTLEDLRQRFGDKAERYMEIYQEFSESIRQNAKKFATEFYQLHLPEMKAFVQEISQVDVAKMAPQELVEFATKTLEHLRTKSCVHFVKAARLGFYYTNKLHDSLKRDLVISDDDLNDLQSLLTQGLDDSGVTDANIAIERAATREEALEIARKLLWHYGEGEMLEVRHVRYKDDLQGLATYVDNLRARNSYTANYEKQRQQRIKATEILFADSVEFRDRVEPILNSSLQYMALRETVKFEFSREYAYLRDALEALGEKLGLEKGQIYHVYPRELASLARDTSSMMHVIRARAQAFEIYPELHMPGIIREEDIERIGTIEEESGAFTQIRGTYLYQGETIEGTIVNVDELGSIAAISAEMNKLEAAGQKVILGCSRTLLHRRMEPNAHVIWGRPP